MAYASGVLLVLSLLLSCAYKSTDGEESFEIGVRGKVEIKLGR